MARVRLKSLTDLGFVANVLKTPSKYPSTRNGFIKDRENLKSDTRKVVSHLNQNTYKYGKEYAR